MSLINFRTLGYNVPEISCSEVHSVREIGEKVLKIIERILDSLSVALYPKAIVKFKLPH